MEVKSIKHEHVNYLYKIAVRTHKCTYFYAIRVEGSKFSKIKFFLSCLSWHLLTWLRASILALSCSSISGSEDICASFCEDSSSFSSMAAVFSSWSCGKCVYMCCEAKDEARILLFNEFWTFAIFFSFFFLCWHVMPFGLNGASEDFYLQKLSYLFNYFIGSWILAFISIYVMH